MPLLDTSAGMIYIGMKYRATWQTHTCLRAIPLHMIQDSRERVGNVTLSCQRCGCANIEILVEEQVASNGIINFRFRIRDRDLGEYRPFTQQESSIGEGHMASEQVRSRFVIARNDYTIFVLTWVGLDGTVLTLIEPAELPDLHQNLQRCLSLIRDVPTQVVEEDEEEAHEEDAMDDGQFERWLAGAHPLAELANAIVHQADTENFGQVEDEESDDGDDADDEGEGEEEDEEMDEDEETEDEEMDEDENEAEDEEEVEDEEAEDEEDEAD
ncbi:retrotransposon-like protein 1 [Trapelia coarctata]|nr:retrotransposon-like protein 1 [Trapelia coarctata]